MRLPIFLTVVVLSAACPPSSTCGPSTCRGCCTSDGTCQTGFEDSACGADGLGCNDCRAASATCNGNHVCLVGSGTGGGGAGGGGVLPVPPGQNDQQLISGTRLKAVRLISSDGAQAPYASVFWDTQLQIACAPSSTVYAFASYYQVFLQPDVGRARCYPSLVAYDIPYVTAVGYRDSACSQQLTAGLQSFYRQYFGVSSGPPSPMGIFSAAGVKYGIKPVDGGTYYTGTYVRATQHTGAVYSRVGGDGGCVLSSAASGDFYVLGADVPETEFAELTVAIDP